MSNELEKEKKELKDKVESLTFILGNLREQYDSLSRNYNELLEQYLDMLGE